MDKTNKFPSEIVELPSKGLLYAEDSPLSSGKIEMKYMTAKEEDILTNQNYIEKGVVIDKLLQSLIVDKKITYNDLLIGDKNALLVAARVLGYGKDYEFIYGDGTSLFIGTGGSARVKLDDDNVWFTGHITASQNISSSGHVMASEYKLKSPSGGDEITIFGTNGDGDFVVGDSGMDDELILYGNLAFINIGNGTAGKIGINNNTPISALDITGDLRVSSHTTVQGNISASGDLFIGKTDSAFVSASNGNIQISGSGRGQLEVDYRLFDTGSSHLSSAGGGVGDIVKFGGSSTTAGDVYYLQPAGTWAQAQANAVGTSTGSLAVALGTNSTTDGMLLKGMVKLDNDPSATIGNPVYLDDTTAGHARNDAPDSGGDIVRIVGHYYSGSGLIYFNPDNTFIEVA